jgi:hypothetical protein
VLQPATASAAAQVHSSNEPAARRPDQPEDAAEAQQPVQALQAAFSAATTSAPTATTAELVRLRVPGDDADVPGVGAILPAIAGRHRRRALRLHNSQQAAWRGRPPGSEGGVLRREPGGEDGVAARAGAGGAGHRRARGPVAGDHPRQDQHRRRHGGELFHDQGLCPVLISLFTVI